MIDVLRMEACARAAHEVNRAYCIALGDTTQPSWDAAPEWQRSSALNGVRGALDGNTPEESHISWLKEKADTGWKYGPVKDPSLKEHPCFRPYTELPPEQRHKDMLFLNTVRSMAAALGMSITYPAISAKPAKDGLPAQPAYPRHMVDWSKEP